MLHSSQYIRLSHNSRNFRHIQLGPAMECCLDERYRRLSAYTKPIYKYKFHKRQILTFFLTTMQFCRLLYGLAAGAGRCGL